MPQHTFENLELHSGNPTSDTIEVIYEKYPVSLEPGIFANGKTEIDLEPTDELKRLAEQAEQLREIPELERLPAILSLLREHVEYPYVDTVEQLQAENAELAEWIREKLLPEGNGGPKKLSEVFEKGFGVCSELSVAYLWLAQHAGLAGVLLQSNHDQITNINRADSGLPLFKATPPGAKAPAHAWVEIQTAERGWVPVDPTTRYIGDSEEKLQTFQDAGYNAHLYVHNLATVENPYVLHAITGIRPLIPGADTIGALTKVALHGPKTTIGGEHHGKVTPPKHQVYSGNAVVEFHDRSDHVGLRFTGIKK